MEIIYLILYLFLILVLIALIVISIKLFKTINKLNAFLDDLQSKLNQQQKRFNLLNNSYTLFASIFKSTSFYLLRYLGKAIVKK